jgi:CheY-like chemotaxis protein
VPHTLLLADDSVTIQRVIELTFADEDVQVVAVGDGEQAIAILNTRPPDIVLADIGMPKADGYEVAQHIRATLSLAHIPVVLLTGAFEPVDEARAAAVGIDAVLTKPFEPQLVITKVKELLAAPRPERALVEAVAAPAGTDPVPPAELPEAVEPVVEPPIQSVSIADVVETVTTFDILDGPLDGPLAPAPATAAVDEYFDRLDQAFASLTEGSPRVPAEDVRLSAEAVGLEDEPRAEASASPADLTSAAGGQPDPAAERPASFPGTVAETRPFPTLSEAFAALLDAEQTGPPSAARPSWPAADAAVAAAPEELMERVTNDVLQRLSDRVVRETVADIVSTVAERMVRDEIDRIKANIRA